MQDVRGQMVAREMIMASQEEEVRLGDVARFKDMCDFTSNSYIKG
jgi:hypothetical protein